MKNFINIDRLGKFILMECRLFWRTYLRLMTAIFALAAIGIFFVFTFGVEGYTTGLLILWCLIFSIIFAPFILYRFVYHPTKSLTYTMLPATSLEKTISAWLQCVVIVPALLIATTVLSLLLKDLFGGADSLRVILSRNYWNIEYISHVHIILQLFAIQSLAFWGVFWFKSRKITKTFLYLALICVGIVVVATLIMNTLNYFNVPKITLSDTMLQALDYLRYLILPILPWTLAFLKFPRTQI